MATPLIAINLIVSGYYQAIGKPLPAMMLALSKQVFTLIPLLLILSYFFQLDGIWYAFGIADVLTAIISFVFFRSALKNLKRKS
jgi:Na+-driven multidrug efflux pump